MTLTATMIPYGYYTSALVDLLPYIKRLAELTDGRTGPDGIVKQWFTGDVQLWGSMDDNGVLVMMAMTKIVNYDCAKFLNIVDVAGAIGTLEQGGEAMLTLIEQYALDEGCAGVEANGRLGWKKFCTPLGYKPHLVQYQKIFGE